MTYKKREIKVVSGVPNRNKIISYLKKIPVQIWSRAGNTSSKEDQLTHDECEALWVRINHSLQYF
jgi:hypothetical protein